MEKRDYWAWLASNEYFYFDKIQKILKVYGTAENLYNISEKKLMSDDRMSPEDIRNIVESRDKFNKEDFYEKLKQKDIKFVTVEDEDYPENLKPYDHRPYYLFYKGTTFFFCFNYNNLVGQTAYYSISLWKMPC